MPRRKKKRSGLSIARSDRKRKQFNWQDGKCYLCRGEMVLQNRRSNSATWDHVVPRALGGSRGYRNLRLACQQCNQAKGHLTLAEYRDKQRIAAL